MPACKLDGFQKVDKLTTSLRLESRKNVLILVVTMFLEEKTRKLTWRLGFFVILVLFLQSCGISENNTPLKEKKMAAGDAGVAYKNDVAGVKEPKGVKTEWATFALG